MTKKKAPKKSTIEAQIKAIDVIGFTIKPQAKLATGNNDYLYDIAMLMKISQEQKILIIETKVTIFSNDDNRIEQADAIIDCAYFMDEMDDYITVNGSEVTFPPDVFRELSRISISTVRGVIFGLLKGTYLHSAILPLFDISAIDIKQS